MMHHSSDDLVCAPRMLLEPDAAKFFLHIAPNGLIIILSESAFDIDYKSLVDFHMQGHDFKVIYFDTLVHNIYKLPIFQGILPHDHSQCFLSICHNESIFSFDHAISWIKKNLYIMIFHIVNIDHHRTYLTLSKISRTISLMKVNTIWGKVL